MHNHSTPTPYFPDNLQEYAPWVATYGLLYPYGECQCGCGEQTTMTSHNHWRRGVGKGQFYRFVSSHTFKPAPEERFWKNVDRREPDQCWPWIAYKSAQGYGTIEIQTKKLLASHMSYELHFGPIPDGLWVLHKCDNPPCVNPSHLFLGNHQDNMDDMAAKGRKVGLSRPGESNPHARLNATQITSIRERHAQGEKQPDLAREYGVTSGYISQIVTYRSWKHIP